MLVEVSHDPVYLPVYFDFDDQGLKGHTIHDPFYTSVCKKKLVFSTSLAEYGAGPRILTFCFLGVVVF